MSFGRAVNYFAPQHKNKEYVRLRVLIYSFVYNSKSRSPICILIVSITLYGYGRGVRHGYDHSGGRLMISSGKMKNRGFTRLCVSKSSLMYSSQIESMIYVQYFPTNLYVYARGINQVSRHSEGWFTISPIKTKNLRIREAGCLKI